MAALSATKKSTPKEVNLGEVLLSWETWDVPPTTRDTRWYAIAGGIGAILLLYALLNANFIFALIVLMFAVITLLRDMRPSKRQQAAITTTGIIFGEEFYPFEAMKDFSVIYDPPDIKYLYLGFQSPLQPVLSIHLDDANPNDIRQSLLPFVFENLERENERLTDILRRVYKL